jgi:hypothetical protein
MNCFPVIAFCHYNSDFVARFFKKAQDRGMTEGDFAWLSFTDFPSTSKLKPWTASSVYNGSDSKYRLSALYAVNLVRQITEIRIKTTEL